MLVQTLLAAAAVKSLDKALSVGFRAGSIEHDPIGIGPQIQISRPKLKQAVRAGPQVSKVMVSNQHFGWSPTMNYRQPP